MTTPRPRTMTIRTESRIVVAGSVRDVWDYLCDVGRWAEWAPTVLECRVRGGRPLETGAIIEQRARDFRTEHRRIERVTVVEAPHAMAFAGTIGSSPARWGMEVLPAGEDSTDAIMWVEADLRNVMRVIPGGILRRRIQRTSDIEMAAIKAAVEADVQAGAGSP
ncbi:SRPBCC family protein [Leifsonia shinshuensis]|uniref:SRPBCC family protein n=1 Tax=Leifsonia shinshuensis TaxID=150026 RepID=A0A7G6Y7Y9_9MICO|nr:SRPBCC family protein [Leifsonia shinshuensis]QNE34604.1 SRPBCC family protein [Leifsonia shinshuensis]